MPVDRDPRVGQSEQGHDQVAHPGVEDLLHSVVRRDRDPHALPCGSRQFRRRLLAEQPEPLGRALQVTARGRVGHREQAHHQANHERVDARLVERDPGRHAEHRVDDPAAQVQGPGQRDRGQERQPDRQRDQVDAAAVDHRDDHDPGHVIDDRERQQVGPHPVRDARTDQGQHAERERGVGRHGRAPAGGRRIAGVDGQVDADRHDHPAQPDHQRQGQPTALT